MHINLMGKFKLMSSYKKSVEMETKIVVIIMEWKIFRFLSFLLGNPFVLVSSLSDFLAQGPTCV